MADKKISALTATTTTAATDIAHVVTGMGGTPTNKKITVANLFKTIPTFIGFGDTVTTICLLYTSPSPRDRTRSRMPSSA